MKSSIPKALLFDFDGIIIDTEWPIYQTYQQLYRMSGHVLELETYVRCIGSDFQDFSPQSHLEELTGKKFDWERINTQRQRHIESEIEKLDALPGIRDSIKYAQKNEIRLAVVSSSSHNWVDRWLQKLSLFEDFETIVCRGDAEKIKPAPDLFQEALRRFDIAPEEALVIEDSHNGLLAAKAAQIPSVAIPNRITAGIDFSIANTVLVSAKHLPSYLAALEAGETPRQ